MKCIVNGLAVNYSDEGDGKVVLMLHGWGSNLRDFDGLAQKLGESYRAVRVDFPGFGGSEQPREDWHVSDYVQFVADFLRQQEIQQVYALAGHSFGGRVIIKGVATSTLVADKVVLIGAAGVKHSDSLRNQALKLVTKIGKALLSLPGLRKLAGRSRAKLYESVGSPDYMNSGTMKQIFLNTINEDLSEYAHDVTAPVLLVWGSEDDQAPLADGRFYAQEMVNSKLKIAASAGHFVHHDEPIQVNRWVREFLDE